MWLHVLQPLQQVVFEWFHFAPSCNNSSSAGHVSCVVVLDCVSFGKTLSDFLRDCEQAWILMLPQRGTQVLGLIHLSQRYHKQTIVESASRHVVSCELTGSEALTRLKAYKSAPLERLTRLKTFKLG